jgi:hypothetical protein
LAAYERMGLQDCTVLEQSTCGGGKELSEREEVAAFVFFGRARAKVGNRRHRHLA